MKLVLVLGEGMHRPNTMFNVFLRSTQYPTFSRTAAASIVRVGGMSAASSIGCTGGHTTDASNRSYVGA